MRSVAKGSMFGAVVRWLAGLAAVAVSSSAFAFGTAARFVIIDNEQAAFSVTGTWSSDLAANTPGINPTQFAEFYRYADGTGGGANATARWEFGNIAPSPGTYQFDAFIPDDATGTGTAVEYHLQSAPHSIISGCGAYGTIVNFAAVDHEAREGNWVNIGTAQLSPGTCYRLVVTNAGNGGLRISANAARAERLFESSATITDMPRTKTAFAAATTNITSSSNGVPTIITTLTVTCPQLGTVVVTGSGESAAVSNAASAFIGLAYSISMDSTATDNTNVVQSSALSTFNGDANRDFLNLQRSDNCTAGQSITYRLTGYATTPQTRIAGAGQSFVWNGRLVAQYFPTSISGF